MKKIFIRETFRDDFISRAAGEKLRGLIIAADQNGEGVEIDFSSIVVGSTSFFDEAIAKLSEEGWNLQKLRQRVVFRHLDPRDEKVLEQMCQVRNLT